MKVVPSRLLFPVAWGKDSSKPAKDIGELTAEQRSSISKRWVEFANRLSGKHAEWHSVRGTSGEDFLQFHYNILSEFAKYLEKQEPDLWKNILNGQLPRWEANTQVPSEFFYESQRPQSKEGYGIGVELPSYFKHGSGDESIDIGFTKRSARSLNDFQSPDELGSAILMGLHATGHTRFGGAMIDAPMSMECPPFLLWHGFLDDIRIEWLKTDSGQKWLFEHPSGWTDPKGNNFDAASSH